VARDPLANSRSVPDNATDVAFKRLLLTSLVFLASLMALACQRAPAGSGSPHGAEPVAAAAPVAGHPLPRFTHIVVIVFENKSYDEVVGSPSAPAFNRLARTGALLTRYYAVAHPSLPNYLALVSGSTHGVTIDCTTCSVRARNLVDLLEARRRSWKVYAEGLPRSGFPGAQVGRYVKKHNPFQYFADVAANPRRRQRIVPLSQLRADLASHRLPSFSLVVPDLCHDMHDCPVATGDRWLRGLLPALLSSGRLAGGVVFVAFDEGPFTDTAGGGGHIPVWAVGPTVRPGARSSALLTHYSLLRTIEDAWGLSRLGRSASARAITGIWR
jgi:phospholipase C